MIEESEHIVVIDLRSEAKAEDIVVHLLRYPAEVLSPDFIVVAATDACAIRSERIAELVVAGRKLTINRGAWQS